MPLCKTCIHDVDVELQYRGEVESFDAWPLPLFVSFISTHPTITHQSQPLALSISLSLSVPLSQSEAQPVLIRKD